jgi:hypothetical protein
MLLLFYAIWFEKAQFDARFVLMDLFHNASVLCFGFGVALIAWIIPGKPSSS